MTINQHAEFFAGKMVVAWDPEVGIRNSETTTYRVSLPYEEWNDMSWTDKFADLLADPGVGSITGLVVGAWNFGGGDEDEPAQRLHSSSALQYLSLLHLSSKLRLRKYVDNTWWRACPCSKRLNCRGTRRNCLLG